jgi:predicted metal-binding transcription factor (methanogenesis marker protein 9)
MAKIDFSAAIRDIEENNKEQTERTIEKLKMLKEIEGKDRLTEDDIRRAMRPTCFSSLAYCCGLEKQCLWRDSALQALKISPSRFKEMKDKFTKELIDSVVDK